MEDAVLRTIARRDGTPFPSSAGLAARWWRGQVARGQLEPGRRPRDRVLRRDRRRHLPGDGPAARPTARRAGTTPAASGAATRSRCCTARTWAPRSRSTCRPEPRAPTTSRGRPAALRAHEQPVDPAVVVGLARTASYVPFVSSSSVARAASAVRRERRRPTPGSPAPRRPTASSATGGEPSPARMFTGAAIPVVSAATVVEVGHAGHEDAARPGREVAPPRAPAAHPLARLVRAPLQVHVGARVDVQRDAALVGGRRARRGHPLGRLGHRAQRRRAGCRSPSPRG